MDSVKFTVTLLIAADWGWLTLHHPCQSEEHSGEGHRLAAALSSRAPQHPRWGHEGVTTVQGAIDSLAPLILQRSHLPPLLGPGNNPTSIVWSVFSHQIMGTLNVLGKHFKKTKKSKTALWGHSWEIKSIFVFKFLIVLCSLEFLPSGFSISQLVEISNACWRHPKLLYILKWYKTERWSHEQNTHLGHCIISQRQMTTISPWSTVTPN